MRDNTKTFLLTLIPLMLLGSYLGIGFAMRGELQAIWVAIWIAASVAVATYGALVSWILQAVEHVFIKHQLERENARGIRSNP